MLGKPLVIRRESNRKLTRRSKLFDLTDFTILRLSVRRRSQIGRMINLQPRHFRETLMSSNVSRNEEAIAPRRYRSRGLFSLSIIGAVELGRHASVSFKFWLQRLALSEFCDTASR